MITCKFAGGLGNNLFQLANVYALHKRYNVDYYINKKFERLTFDGKPLKNDSRFKQSHKLELERLFENEFPSLDEKPKAMNNIIITISEETVIFFSQKSLFKITPSITDTTNQTNILLIVV